MAGAAKKRKKKPPAPGAGAPSRSEPKVQLFSKFNGCDFRLSPNDFHTSFDPSAQEQTDLMPMFMAIQNNASVAAMGGIETRQSLETLFDAPAGKLFTGVATLINNRLYAACDDGSVHHGVLPTSGTGLIGATVEIDDQDESTTQDNTWTFLGRADDKLVGLTAGKQLWTGEVGLHKLSNAKVVPDPPALSIGDLVAKGSLAISDGLTEACPFRISIGYTRLNQYGPTLPSPMYTFYASKPTSEWSTAAYVQVNGTSETHAAPDTYQIRGIELYYTEGEYRDPAFLARINLSKDNGSPKEWTYNWTGYLYDTSMWTIANLIAPEKNYTAGVPATNMASHDGQLYFWGGEPKHRIWVGGNPGNRFSISTGTGGGFVDVEPGTGTEVSSILKFKTTQGAAIVTALCDNPNSHAENRFNLVENNITISDEQSAKGWQAEKIAGTVGCKSPKGAVVAGDGLYAVSRYGLALTTITMEYSSQLKVEYVSDPIEPIFLSLFGTQLEHAVLFSVNDILYLAFGRADGAIDNVIFCYDIKLKAWWTYTLDTDAPILSMINIDSHDNREGIGVITESAVFLLPTTRPDARGLIPLHDVLIESAELSTMVPLQAMHHLSQMEFRFDYFIGDVEIIVTMIDQFGRNIETRRRVSHDTIQFGLAEHIRIDAVVESYKITVTGKARMRLTHFLARTYPKSNRIGMAYGFNSEQSHSSRGSVRRTFSSYNDLKNAIIP